MTIIEATCAGFKDLADGTVRFMFDVEPRHAEAALRLFRSRGTAAALAALVPGVQAEPETERKKPARMGPLQEWAVYRCKEHPFQQWIRPVYDKAMGGDGGGWGDVTPKRDFGGDMEAYARHALLVLTEIQSRKELDAYSAVSERFKKVIMDPYARWLKQRPE